MAKKKEAYLYISAMLRARETRMLSRDKAERMLDAASFEDAAKILADCGYEDMSSMNAKQVESALSAHRDKVFGELASCVPDKAIVDIFRVKYDYHNAKVLIKAEAVGSDETGSFAGGLVMRRGNVEANCTAELLIELCRADMAAELAGVLFE